MPTPRQGQLSLGQFSEHARTDYARADRYGQQSLPGLSQRPTPASTPTHLDDYEEPHQLKMLMSQREIMQQYQPLDADRNEVYDEREGEATGRAFTTMGNPNPKIRTNDRAAPFLQHQGSAAVRATHYRDFGQTESHDQMMDRKLNESKMSYGEYREHHQGGENTEGKTPGWEEIMERSGAPQYQPGHTGTYDHAMNEHVENEVSKHYDRENFGSLYGDMEEAMKPGGVGFTGLVHLATGQFGMKDRPQIAGAHHRLAALGEIAPDRLLPVVHHESMKDARWGKSAKTFPYT